MALPYQPDDDRAADRYINDLLRLKDPLHDGWRQLESDDYVEQTSRVLRRTLDAIKTDREHRAIETMAVRARRDAGEVSPIVFAEHIAVPATAINESTVDSTLASSEESPK